MRTETSAEHGFAVCAYGRSPFLEGCLLSLKAQSRQSPIVVCTSTPSAWLDEVVLRHQVELIVNPHRDGIGADWNFALSAAPWRRVTLAHQDDVYLPRFAEASLRALDDTPEAAMAFTDHREVSDDGQARSNRVIAVKRLITVMAVGGRTRVSGLRQRALLAFGNPVACSAVTLERKHLPTFRFSTDLASNLDWDGWWKVHQAGFSFVYVPELLVERRYNDLSATSSLLQNGDRAREDRLMFRRMWPAPLGDLWAMVYRVGYRD